MDLDQIWYLFNSQIIRPKIIWKRIRIVDLIPFLDRFVPTSSRAINDKQLRGGHILMMPMEALLYDKQGK